MQSLPLTIVLTFDINLSSLIIYLSFFLFYCNYGIDFYMIYLTSSKFRKELLGKK